MTTMAVRFLCKNSPYRKGEVAWFQEEDAKRLCEGVDPPVAEYVQEENPMNVDPRKTEKDGVWQREIEVAPMDREMKPEQVEKKEPRRGRKPKK